MNVPTMGIWLVHADPVMLVKSNPPNTTLSIWKGVSWPGYLEYKIAKKYPMAHGHDSCQIQDLKILQAMKQVRHLWNWVMLVLFFFCHWFHYLAENSQGCQESGRWMTKPSADFFGLKGFPTLSLDLLEFNKNVATMCSNEKNLLGRFVFLVL